MLDADDAIALLESRRARKTKPTGNVVPIRDPTVWIDWHTLFGREVHATWLVEDVWPAGRQVHMHAARKTGKSLVSLWMACMLARGRDPFTNAVQPRIHVAYFDYEMTEDDLLERVEDMGFTADDLEYLHYALTPMIPPLDTWQGGSKLVELVESVGAEAVVIDTMSRVVSGEENSNDTFVKFYANTGMLLKQRGIALLRLDHEGHEGGRSRGASAKADDVDVVWQLRKADGNAFELVRMASRVAWVPEMVVVVRDEPLGFHRGTKAWPNGTVDAAQRLNEANVPLDASKRTAIKMLKEAGLPQGNTVVLLAAMRYRAMVRDHGVGNGP